MDLLTPAETKTDENKITKFRFRQIERPSRAAFWKI